MKRPRRTQGKSIPTTPVQCRIEKLGHDGRGIAHLEGKVQFVDGALPGDLVEARYTFCHRRYDELTTLKVLTPAPERIEPPCVHARSCGGCSLQHLATDAQILFKESVLREQFAHFGGIEPQTWEPPMRAATEGYRRKARLGVHFLAKRNEVLIGFREKRNNLIANVQHCTVMDERVGVHLPALSALVRGLSAFDQIAQIEVACGDDDTALVFRHLRPLTEVDLAALRGFGQARSMQIYLQPQGPDSVYRLWPERSAGDDRLYYRLDDFGLRMAFHPLDFTQVNAEINRKMVRLALEWLDPQPEDRVLDLFCGLGNFTLPLATRAKSVVGIEGDEAMVVRGRENATANGLSNVEFYGANLQGDFTAAPWTKEGFDRILIDPPRSGALEVVQYLPAFKARRIVYVSCNPATLARDAGVLAQHGYRLLKAGVMDMFPHTAHVESIALFER